MDGVIIHGPKMNDSRVALLQELKLPFVVHGRTLQDEDSYSWLDAYGNSVTMTVNDLRSLVGIIATQRSLVYNKEATKIKEINDAQTTEEVNLIDWNLSFATSPGFVSGVIDS